MINPRYIIENERYILCQPMSESSFVRYCKDRGVNTSSKQLERLEKLGLFYPLVRVRYPKIRIKVEYLEDGTRYKQLGVLQDNETWDGDLRDDYASFWFHKNIVEAYIEEELLWVPSERPFQPWKTFTDNEYNRAVESYYSIYQLFDLRLIRTALTLQANLEWCETWADDWISQVLNYTDKTIKTIKEGPRLAANAALICQAISNRYYPHSKSDRRSIRIGRRTHYYDWDWDEYRLKWNPENELKQLGIPPEDLKKLADFVQLKATSVDPLEKWYGLVSFVSLERKEKLKDKALLAQEFYGMVKMLKLFYKDVTGDELPPPDESTGWKKDYYYGEGITADELKYLEFLANEFHLNPRPKLILIVEGDSEEDQLPRLVEEVFGASLPKYGIEIVNIRGIGNFDGKKRIDRFSALERFIDDHHHRQTIVFVLLDNEGRASETKKRLVKAKSKYSPSRMVTKAEYIHIWDKSIEWDNFSHDEIARAMTELSADSQDFTVDEITKAIGQWGNVSDPLSSLYKDKTRHDLDKPRLLGRLVQKIIENVQDEVDENGAPIRPIIRVLQKVIGLANRNYPPSSMDIWLENQKSGYFGDVVDEGDDQEQSSTERQ